MRCNKKIVFLSIIVLSISFTSLFNCFDNNDSTTTYNTYNQVIIDNDDFFAGSHWNDPHVLYRDGQFIMYASSDISWDGIVKIYRLTSPDGKNWTLSNSGNPVLGPSASGWDSHCTETPAVVYFNGEYHMFYTGYDVAYDYTNNDAGTPLDPYDDDIAPKHFRIGHATSNDGITWTKDTTNNPIVSPTAPYVAPNLDFNQTVIGEPGPVVFNNKIYLYFTAAGGQLDVGTTWQTIGLVTSSNGTNWDTPRRVLTPDLAQYPRTTGDQYIGYSTPNAIVINDKVHLYYDVALNSPWTQVKIHHGYSPDGETGWTQDSAPLLNREDHLWTASEIRSPAPLIYNNNLYLYYAGHYFAGVNPILVIGLKVYDNVP